MLVFHPPSFQLWGSITTPPWCRCHSTTHATIVSQVNSLLFAGWAALIFNSLNLIPTGELDGGRIALAIFGRRPASLFGIFTIAALAITSFSSPLVRTGNSAHAHGWGKNWLALTSEAPWLKQQGKAGVLRSITLLSSPQMGTSGVTACACGARESWH